LTGIFIIGASIAGTISVIDTIGFLAIGMVYASPALPIVVPVIGVAAKAHKQSLTAQALQTAQTESFIEQLIIEPHTVKDFLLLVKKEDYKNQFTLTVQHQYATTTFDVMLPENMKKKTRLV
jgi:hypothetical protein